jgi:hypothetical protein
LVGRKFKTQNFWGIEQEKIEFIPLPHWNLERFLNDDFGGLLKYGLFGTKDKRIDIMVYEKDWWGNLKNGLELDEKQKNIEMIYELLHDTRKVVVIYDLDLEDHIITSKLLERYPDEMKEFFNLPLPQNGVEFNKWIEKGKIEIIDKIIEKDNADKVWERSELIHAVLAPKKGMADYHIIAIVEYFDDVVLVSNDEDTLINGIIEQIKNIELYGNQKNMKDEGSIQIKIRYDKLSKADKDVFKMFNILKVKKKVLHPQQVIELINKNDRKDMPLFLIDTNIFIDRRNSVENEYQNDKDQERIIPVLNMWNIHFETQKSRFLVVNSILGEFRINPFKTQFGRRK